MAKLRIAVVGAGLIGQKHIELVAASNECVLAAICDADSRARGIAEKYETPFYTEVEPLLAEQKLDGAIIAAPTNLHAPLALACIERGVHVLIEKPISSTVAEAGVIRAAAEQAGVQVLVGHHRRHNALVQAARGIVERGDLGAPVAVSAQFLLYKPDDYFEVRWRTERGGGPILINLIHDLDNLRFIFGEIESVFAMTSARVRGFAVEDTASVTLQFTNGALGTGLVSDTTPAPWSYELTSGENPMYPNYAEDCYRFMGTRGALAFPSLTVWQYAAGVERGWREGLVTARAVIERNDALAAQLEHFCRVIRGEVMPLVSAREGERTLAVTLAVIEAARRGAVVRVREIF